MYSKGMYSRIWKDYQKEFFRKNPRLPRQKTFSVGRALWAISRQKRIKYIQIATKTGISEGSIIRMSASHQLTTTPQKVKQLAHAVDTNLDDFFQMAREEFYGNFFITKAAMPPEKEVKDYAKHGVFLHLQTLFKYPNTESPDFRVIVHTPPVESLVDFFAASFLIAPGKTITGLKLPKPITIHLANMNGRIKILSEENETEEIMAGQPVLFNGGVEHSIVNLSKDREAEILISFSPTAVLAYDKKMPRSKRFTSENLDIPALIEQVRIWLSPDPEKPIPLSEVALLAGLPPRDLDRVMKGMVLNFPIDKLERLAECVGVSMDQFFRGEPFNSGLNAQITKGSERGIYDYSARFGMTFYPWLKIGLEKQRFFMGQANMGTHSMPQGATVGSTPLKEKIWEGKNPGYLLVKGMNGKIGAQLGERHNYPDIDREDTIYCDMSLGYSFRNYSPAEPTNFFLVTNPSLF